MRAPSESESESASESESESESESGSGSASASGFRFACEDCAYFVEEQGACANGYPNHEHRRGARTIVFCKEFELA